MNLFAAGLISAMILMSLVVLTGWAGQISLGQLAFVAFGMSVAGVLAQQGKDIFLTITVAGFVGAMVAMVIGIPAIRIRGLFLAVTTLAFAIATGTFFLNEEFFPWFVPDESLPSCPSGAVQQVRPRIRARVLLLRARSRRRSSSASVWSLRHSRTGRALVAARDNSRAAQSYGVSPIRAQLTAFGSSGFIAGVAGGVFF